MTRQGIVTSRVLLVTACVTAPACSIDTSANPGLRCDDQPCPEGLTCYRGFCISDADGGDACTTEGEVRPCYGGDPSTISVGVCRQGQQRCNGGAWSSCTGQLVPSAETCNGRDDDCNAMIDDVAPVSCDTGEPGICATGEAVCSGGAEICAPRVGAATESCNGQDDDCDGATDEDSGTACYTGPRGCEDSGDGSFACVGACRSGVRECASGRLGACEGEVLPAAGEDGCTAAGATAVDDDCDGSIDEDCACEVGDSQTCYGGPTGTAGQGECRMGTQTCADGVDGPRFGACEGATLPTAESCQNPGADDDCNGVADDIADLGDPCSVPGAFGPCSVGALSCNGETLECTAPPPSGDEETLCDGVDEDCDGNVDESFDLSTDPQHCGACDQACGVGLDCCDFQCVNLGFDTTHCGVCGRACAPGESCCAGTCRASCDACTGCGDGEDCCGGACVDVSSSNAHCGGCDRPCSTQCVDGQCCAAGEDAVCGDSCTNTDMDPSHCGRCNRRCPPGRPSCVAGECMATAAASGQEGGT